MSTWLSLSQSEPRKKENRVAALTFVQKSNKALFLLLGLLFILLPTGKTNAEFYTEATIQDNTFSTGCWTAPSTPILSTLVNNSVIYQPNPWLTNPLMSWQASTSSCPTAQIVYQFKVASDPGLTNVLQTSAWISPNEFVTNATSSGEYYWQVTASDSAHPDIAPTASDIFHYTVDLSTFDTPQILGWNRESQGSAENAVPTDLTCNSNTSDGTDGTHRLSLVWDPVPGNNVKYIVSVDKKGSSPPLISEVFSDHYSPFIIFSALPQPYGNWRAQVQAFEDDNGNDLYDSGERIGLSAECPITISNRSNPSSIVNSVSVDSFSSSFHLLESTTSSHVKTPAMQITQQDAHNVVVDISQATAYQTANILIEYSRDQDGQSVEDGFMKQVPITENPQKVSDLFLGTVSSGVEYPYYNIQNLRATVTLHSDVLPDKTIEASMSGEWKAE